MSKSAMRKDDRGPNGRVSQFTYPTRKQYALRLPAALHAQLCDAAHTACIPHNRYISTVMEMWLADDVPSAELAAFSEGRSDERITVTLRLLPSLFARVKARAERENTNVNRLFTYVLHLTLYQESKHEGR